MNTRLSQLDKAVPLALAALIAIIGLGKPTSSEEAISTPPSWRLSGLTGSPANDIIENTSLDPSYPLLGGDDEGPIAWILCDDEQNCEEKLNKLLVDDFPGCNQEDGGLCCDFRELGELLLKSDVGAWLRTGLKCEASEFIDQRGNDVIFDQYDNIVDFSEPVPVELEEIPTDIALDLKLAYGDIERRLLGVAKGGQGLSLLLDLGQNIGIPLDELLESKGFSSLQIRRTASVSSCVSNLRRSCRKGRNRRCNKDNRRIYYYVGSTSKPPRH